VSDYADEQLELVRNARARKEYEHLKRLITKAVKSGKPQEIGLWAPTCQTLWIVATDDREPPG